VAAIADTKWSADFWDFFRSEPALLGIAMAPLCAIVSLSGAMAGVLAAAIQVERDTLEAAIARHALESKSGLVWDDRIR